MEKKRVGVVTHYFPKIGVAIVSLEEELRLGDRIHIKGSTTDFEQEVDSMQIEHAPVELAKKGDTIGLKVKERVREKDIVFKVIQP